uniref:Uncharacterized protein n=1 Tax=Manihot esculenta TaxID=3983 RepID=A0A2C9UXU8_MANES
MLGLFHGEAFCGRCVERVVLLLILGSVKLLNSN